MSQNTEGPGTVERLREPRSRQIETPARTEEKKPPPLDVTCSRQFIPWLAEHRLSLAFTTYQAAKLFLVGLQPNDRLSLYKRTIPRCMGMTAHGNSLWVSSLWQLWRFENILERGQSQDGFDRVYVPEVGYVTGDIDMHDMAVDRDGRLVFVNTLFACLATALLPKSRADLMRRSSNSRD